MTFSKCAICDKEERDDLIPGWLRFGNGRIICNDCQLVVVEKNLEMMP